MRNSALRNRLNTGQKLLCVVGYSGCELNEIRVVPGDCRAARTLRLSPMAENADLPISILVRPQDGISDVREFLER